MELTDKQEKFISEYLVDLNATQAAIRAGYSKNRASEIGYQQLQKTTVQQAIQKAQKKITDKLKVDAEYVLRRHIEIDEMDVSDILDDDGSILPIQDWPKCWRRTLSGLDISTIVIDGEKNIESIMKKIKWPDKVRNLELLGKHIDVQAYRDKISTAFDGKVEVTINRLSGN